MIFFKSQDDFHEYVLSLRLIEKAYAFAKKEVGVHEGGDSDKRVIEYLHSVDLDESEQEDSGTPWCSAFVNWCMQKAGGKGTRNAMARSWLQWGRKITEPEEGCVVVFWRGSPDSDSGHVAFFLGYNEDKSGVKVLGGNQSDSVCIKYYDSNRILGFRTSKD